MQIKSRVEEYGVRHISFENRTEDMIARVGRITNLCQRIDHAKRYDGALYISEDDYKDLNLALNYYLEDFLVPEINIEKSRLTAQIQRGNETIEKLRARVNELESRLENIPQPVVEETVE